MPHVKGPATSLWPRGREGDVLRFADSPLAWIGTLIQYAIAVTLGGFSLRAVLDGSLLGGAGLAFVALYLAFLTRSAFSTYELRLDERARRLIRSGKPFLGKPWSETVDAAEVGEISFEESEVSSVSILMKDGRRLVLDRGTAADPLRALAREASRVLGAKLTEATPS